MQSSDEQSTHYFSGNSVERLEKLLSHLGRQIERFVKNSTRVDLASAFASGLCVSAILCLVSISSREKLDVHFCLVVIITAVASYLSAALLLRRFWTGLLRRILPNWTMIAVLGTLLFFVIKFIPPVINRWNDPETKKMWSGLTEFSVYELEGMRIGFVYFSLLTLLITGVFHYAHSIIRAVRLWHEGPEIPPSILSKPASKE